MNPGTPICWGCYRISNIGLSFYGCFFICFLHSHKMQPVPYQHVYMIIVRAMPSNQPGTKHAAGARMASHRLLHIVTCHMADR